MGRMAHGSLYRVLYPKSMAKISANGARSLIAIETEPEAADTSVSDGTTYKVRAVLCSDGRILWRLSSTTTYRYSGKHTNGGTYKVLGKVKRPAAEYSPAEVIALVAKRLRGNGWHEVAA